MRERHDSTIKQEPNQELTIQVGRLAIIAKPAKQPSYHYFVQLHEDLDFIVSASVTPTLCMSDNNLLNIFHTNQDTIWVFELAWIAKIRIVIVQAGQAIYHDFLVSLPHPLG